MQDVNVVVVFFADAGSMERLAQAAAVGAVQGRALIRLRRLPDVHYDSTYVEYVAPRDADAEWADAIMVGMPPEMDSLPEDFARYLGKLAGKIGASYTDGAGSASLGATMQRAGLVTAAVMSGADALEAARLQGRRVADMARSLRSGRIGK
jgi:NAD(P)H dehydrogenase (quinone)